MYLLQIYSNLCMLTLYHIIILNEKVHKNNIVYQKTSKHKKGQPKN